MIYYYYYFLFPLIPFHLKNLISTEISMKYIGSFKTRTRTYVLYREYSKTSMKYLANFEESRKSGCTRSSEFYDTYSLSLFLAHTHIHTHNCEKVRFYGLKFQLRLGDRMDLKKTSSGYAWRRTRRRGKSFDLFYRKAFNPLPLLPPIKMTHFSPLVPLHLFSFSPPIALFSWKIQIFAALRVSCRKSNRSIRVHSKEKYFPCFPFFFLFQNSKDRATKNSNFKGR